MHPNESQFDQRAYSIDDFRRAFRIGRTLIYALIRDGKLSARRVGGRTIITTDDAQKWLDSLPRVCETRAQEATHLSGPLGQ